MDEQETKPKGFKFSNFKVNKKKAVDGVDFQYAPGLILTVARFSGPKVQNYIRKAQKPYKYMINNGTMDEETSRGILIKALAKFCLLGWEGLIDDDENPIVYSEQQAIKCLEEEDFFVDVLSICQSKETFQDLDEDDFEEAKGNS